MPGSSGCVMHDVPPPGRTGMTTAEPGLDRPADIRPPTDREAPGSPDVPASSASRRAIKGCGVALGLLVAVLPAATCWVEARLSSRDDVFMFWAQAFSLAPGLLGKYLRKGFYYLTLRRFSP